MHGTGNPLRNAVRLDRIAKVGFLARALVYIVLGWIALQARRRADEGQNAVFDALREMPAGAVLPAGGVLIVATATGLIAYGVYRLSTAVLDLDHKGRRWKGWAARAGALISGFAHSLLGFTAFQFLSEHKQSTPSDHRSQEAARTLLDLPLGGLLLGLVGGYFLLIALSQAHKAWKASFMDEISLVAPPFTCMFGRIGHLARAVVFAAIGWSFVKAAWLEDEDKALAIGGALVSLRASEWLYTVVAAGLLVFGLFSLILAQYRIVPPLPVPDAARRMA